MGKIKKVKLDKDDFMERSSMSSGGGKPQIIPGMEITLYQNGIKLTATAGPKQNSGGNSTTCKVENLSENESKYENVSIGDTIEFEECHIFSLH